MAAGREDSKGVALGGLIARFTADRDAMLAQVHACQERVQDLVGRLDEHGLSMGGPSPASSPERLDELETAVALLRDEVTTVTADGHRAARDLRSLVEAVRTTAIQAMERADRASADVDAVLERLGVEIARLAADGAADDVASLRAAVERLEAGGGVGTIAPLEAAAAAAELEGLRDEVARLARLVEQLGAVQAQWETTFADDAARRQSLSDVVARLTAAQADTEGAMARLAAAQGDAAAKLEGLVAGPGDEALAATRRELEAALAAVVAGQRPLADGVDDLQQGQQSLRVQLERLRDTVEGLTGRAGEAVSREALAVVESAVAAIGTRVETVEGDRTALRDEVARACADAAAARQAAAVAADAVAGVRRELQGAAETAEAAVRTAAEGGATDRRRIEDLVHREAAGLRAALERGLAGLGSRLDDASRDLDGLAEARDRLRDELASAAEIASATQRRATADGERLVAVGTDVQRIAATFDAFDARLRVMEETMTRVVATRDPEWKTAWWGAAEALWVQVSAFVATPKIDFREALWQLARAASSAAKFQ
ncbi:MAG: hypothetical protein KIT14_04765 [bacterium]|nr:hypothetical protein [bacterium]